jgi:nucleobase:cation symporter-1, NCS1 family
MVTAIWPSYANIPNKLPASANITSNALLMVFLYWFVQTGVSCLPMYRLRYFFRFKAIVVPPAFFALFLWGYDSLAISLIPVQLLLMEVDL